MDNITILEVWAAMAASCSALAILVLYSNVVQSQMRAVPKMMRALVAKTRRPAPEHFALHEPDINNLHQERLFFEKEPLTLRRMVSVVDVTKDFASTTSLSHVSMNVYNGQITVLLGHNGAGKTTLMNIIAGMLQPDSGKVLVDGTNLTECPDKAPDVVSFCQQKAVFFQDLTVWEHLVFYATLKERRPTQLQNRICHALKQARLTDKRDCLCQTLSGGQKQRLSIAIATLTRPKVVILDEPSSSLDPDSRRELWDVLLAMRRGRAAVLVSTHDMREAEVLADRVVLMCRGRVACAGTPTFLKKLFDSGCQVNIVKHDDTFRVEHVLSAVRELAPEAAIRGDRLHEVSLKLGSCGPQQMADVLRLLEERSQELGVAAVGVNTTTLEDVYIRVYEIACADSLDGPTSKTKGGRYCTPTPPFRADIAAATDRSIPQRASTKARLAALLAKRRLCFARSRATPLLCWLLPAAVFFAQFRLERDLMTKRNPLTARLDLVSRDVETKQINVRPKELYPDGATFVQVDNASANFVRNYYGPVSRGSVSSIVSVSSAEETLLSIGASNFLDYVRSFVFGSVFRQEELEAWWNPNAVLSSVLALNAMHTALLRHLSGDASANIDMKLRLYKEEESIVGPLLDFSKAARRDALAVVLPMFIRAVFVPLAVALSIAPLALQPCTERVGGVLAVQLMAGVSPALMWTANLAFDLCIYALAWSLVGTMLNTQYNLAVETNAAIFAVVLAFSVVGICTAYLIASLSKSPAAAFTLTALFFFLGGAAPMFVYMVVTALDVSRGTEAPRWAPASLSPLPAFAFPWALVKLLQLDAENAQCERYARTRHGELYQIDIFCMALSSNNRFPGAMHFCCEHYTNNATVELKTLNPFSFHQAGVGLEILIMAAEGAVFFALVVWRDSRPRTGWRLGQFSDYLLSFYTRGNNDEGAEEVDLDADVCAEKELVRSELRTGLDGTRNAVVVDEVHKRYGHVHAVRGVSLAVRPRECVGLLGANGAGKSTTFRLLAAISRATKGDAYTSRAVLSRDPRKWQSSIGYCPQSDSLLDMLTAREYLRMIARLRGVPEAEIAPLVEFLLAAVRLSDHAARMCGDYSGGSRRKLSVAAALVGLPRVVFLDEPTAGVDVLARRDILEALRTISNACGTAVIITSHMMEECEAACDRVGIMANGRFRCLGPLRSIRDRYGRGCTIVINASDDHRRPAESIDSVVQEILPHSRRLRSFKGRYEYQLDKSMSWGAILPKLELLKASLGVEDISLSPMTLEDIFSDFAAVDRQSGAEGS